MFLPIVPPEPATLPVDLSQPAMENYTNPDLPGPRPPTK